MLIVKTEMIQYSLVYSLELALCFVGTFPPVLIYNVGSQSGFVIASLSMLNFEISY